MQLCIRPSPDAKLPNISDNDKKDLPKKDIMKKLSYTGIREGWGKIKLESFNFQLIKSYFKNSDNSASFQVVSDRTIDDIDFEELFMFVDRTNSKIGQQYLYSRLLTIDLNYDFSEQERLIEFFRQDEEGRIRMQQQLSRLNKHEAYYLSSLFQSEYMEKPKWFWIIPSLSVLTVLSLALTLFFPKLLFAFVLLVVINLFFHYSNKKNIYIYTDSVPQLLLLIKTAKDILKTHPNGSVSESLKSLEAQKRGMAIFSIESKSDSDIGIIIWSVLEYLKIVLLIEPIIVFRTLKRLEYKRNDISNLFKYIGRIDASISIASLRSSLNNFCKPKISEEQILSFDGIYHPLIANCVANTFDGSKKSILLTGSNMSGKTTFIRTVAINVLCAQTINTCFAEKFALKPMQLYSAIRITDDLMSDKSYYFEEVLAIKQMIDESRRDSYKLFLLDEIFKGTNTVERIAAGKAVLSYIGRGNNLVFVSTHDIELTELLKDTYELYHFTETVENSSILFDYKLKKGSLATRNAIRILELNGYPKEVTNEAKEISRKLLPLTTPSLTN